MKSERRVLGREHSLAKFPREERAMWLKHTVKIRLASQVTGMLREGIDCIPSGRGAMTRFAC